MSALAHRPWLDDDDARRLLLAVPLGSCEQHGPHLPLDTDTRIAVAVAEGLAAVDARVRVAPALAYGASGEHAGFAGTLSMGLPALEHTLIELVRSADAFAGTVLINGHGGNAAAVAGAVARLTKEGRRVLAWSPVIAGGDAHAGRTETSLLLAIAPDLVVGPLPMAGATEPIAELLPRLRADGVRAVSPSGVLGDPAGASADEGAGLLAALIADVVAAVAAWATAAAAGTRG